MHYRLLAYLATGIRTYDDIQKRLGLSQPTVSRLIASLSEEIVVIGKARARRYTSRRDVRGLGGDFPVFRINRDGNASSDGVLSAIGHDEYLWQPKIGEAVASKSLPWFLADLRPEYRPMDGAAPVKAFRPPAFSTSAAGEWDSALGAAIVFWDRAGEDLRISRILG